MTDFIYYINGEYVPASQAAIGLNDLGLVRGYGVFDFTRTYGRVPFRLGEHIQRLEYSAAQIDLPLPWSAEEIDAIVQATLARNDVDDVGVRIVVTGGPSANFTTPEDHPSLLVLISAIKPYPEHDFTQGASLITVDFDRFMPSVKSLNYITAIMAQKRARQAGAVEALYRTPAGHVTECTTCNFFIVRGDQLITPEADVLAGVTRSATLELADDLFEVVRRSIRYDELATADEAFITSTTKEIMPIVRIDDIVIGNGLPGPGTRRLRQLFREYTKALATPA